MELSNSLVLAVLIGAVAAFQHFRIQAQKLPPLPQGCAAQLGVLLPCLPFVQARDGNPSPKCCNGLGTIVSVNPGCLCALINSGTASNQGIINVTLALSLPSRCNLPGITPAICNPTGGSPPVSPAVPPPTTYVPPTPPYPSPPTSVPPYNPSVGSPPSPPSDNPSVDSPPTPSPTSSTEDSTSEIVHRSPAHDRHSGKDLVFFFTAVVAVSYNIIQ